MSDLSNYALEKLKEGNRRYLAAKTPSGDISPEIREKTFAEGQKPYAVVIACSDSRVIPESIFSAGIGEIFTIRVAGNVIGEHQLASAEYAVDHLGCKLVLVLGHDGCGAVGAAISGGGHGSVKAITDEIRLAIGGETDGLKAARLNAIKSAEKLGAALRSFPDVEVVAAIYHTATGEVEVIK